MIGTGAFATLGLQADTSSNGAALLLIWILGGITALCGALCYGELAAAIPRSGGEYHFLSRVFHPSLGQLAGWVSVTIGFAAPIALASMALGHYASTIVPVGPSSIAVVTLLLVTSFHAFDLNLGRIFQVVATIVKILVIALFCVAAFRVEPVPGSLSLTPDTNTLRAVFSTSFGLSLIYVSYAYSGWNAAAYIVDEVQQPQRTVPRALVHGTLLVTGLYVLLNLGFLRTIGAEELAGTVEVGALSARNLFGEQGGAILSLVLSLILVSTISAMVLAGPRVLSVIGEDIPALRFLSLRNRRGAPTRAVLLQQIIALLFIATDSFEGVLTFAGSTLILFSLLTVVGLIRLRIREPQLDRPFKVPLYPLPPVVFLAVSGASLLVVTIARPVTLLAVFGLLAVGWLLIRSRKSP